MLFEGARLGLDRLAEAVDRASGSDPASLSVAATHIARENPFVVDAIVQDRRGVVVAAAGPGDGVGLDLGHLDHVRALLAPGAARYWIGEPFDARGMGDVLVPLARTVTDAGGEVVAIVAVGVSRNAVLQALAGVNDGFETFLWRADGTLLAVPDGVRLATGRRYPEAPLWRHWRRDIDVGVYEGIVPGGPKHHLHVKGPGRLHEPEHDVVRRSRKQHPRLTDEGSQCRLGRQVGHHRIHIGVHLPKSTHTVFKDRGAPEVREDLAGETGRRHPGLKENPRLTHIDLGCGRRTSHGGSTSGRPRAGAASGTNQSPRA
jgi:hypothetical protein